jgi:hypothetical protein
VPVNIHSVIKNQGRIGEISPEDESVPEEEFRESEIISPSVNQDSVLPVRVVMPD